MVGFSVEPVDGWQPGDLAFCMRGTSKTKPPLSAGKLYVVAVARKINGYAHSSLTLRGVELPGGFEGFSSGRFVRLRRSEGSFLKQIENLTEHTWGGAHMRLSGREPA